MALQHSASDPTSSVLHDRHNSSPAFRTPLSRYPDRLPSVSDFSFIVIPYLRYSNRGAVYCQITRLRCKIIFHSYLFSAIQENDFDLDIVGGLSLLLC